MNLAEHEIIQLTDFLRRLKPQSSSYLDLIGQPDNTTATITGHMGQYLSATLAEASALALTTNTALNVTSLSLTAGDWDVWGSVWFSGNAATTVAWAAGSVGTTSATLSSDLGALTRIFMNSEVPFATTFFNVNAGPTRIHLSATTTTYLVARAVFAVNTMSAYGTIQARRCRHFPG